MCLAGILPKTSTREEYYPLVYCAASLVGGSFFFLGQDCSLIDACATNPCENGARCTNWNGRYNCTCPPGYQGRSCRLDIDECRTSGLCQNGGQCINTPGSFRCRCPSSFTGQFCEANYVPCAPSQCQNGGTCRPTGELSYQCVCLPGKEMSPLICPFFLKCVTL